MRAGRNPCASTTRSWRHSPDMMRMRQPTYGASTCRARERSSRRARTPSRPRMQDRASASAAHDNHQREAAMSDSYDRDLIGYGRNPPDPKWPNGARLALNFVMNYEEGSEPSVQDGEGYTELGLTE